MVQQSRRRKSENFDKRAANSDPIIITNYPTMLRSLLLCFLGIALVASLTDLPLNANLIGSSLDKKGGSSSDCESKSYRKNVLKLIKETPFAGLFRDVKNQTKFEASGVAAVRGKYYVVFDSSMALGVLDDSFSFRGENNVLIGDVGPESQFEGIAYVPENDTFLLLHEALPEQQKKKKNSLSLKKTTTSSSATDTTSNDSKPTTESTDNTENNSPQNADYTPYITTVKINADNTDYEIINQCPVDFILAYDNKGFESIMYIHTLDGEAYMLGLCEGNYCLGGSQGADPGNGRIVVSQLEFFADGCVWKPQKTITIPISAYFADYSGMAFNYATKKFAVLSQENAAVWIGDFDIEKVDFSSEEGVLYHLPRSDTTCQTVFCNAEGIQWLDNYRLLIASDKAKSTQPYWCGPHDQSIGIFAMPPGWDPWQPAASQNSDFDAMNDEL